MTKYVYLDTETTGLDPDRHEVVEVAWCVDNGPINNLRPPHTLFTADPRALAINKYDERGLGRPSTWAHPDDLRMLYDDLGGATLVGANPAFDAAFLAGLFGGDRPWHHRLLDVEAYGHGVFGSHGKLLGLAGLRDKLVGFGYDIPVPDHTAAMDVEVTRAVLRALENHVGVLA